MRCTRQHVHIFSYKPNSEDMYQPAELIKESHIIAYCAPTNNPTEKQDKHQALHQTEYILPLKTSKEVCKETKLKPKCEYGSKNL